MSESHETTYFDTVYELLPAALKANIEELLTKSCERPVRHTLDQLVCFCLNGDTDDDPDPNSREEQVTQRSKIKNSLLDLRTKIEKGRKRAREDNSLDDSKAKKVKTISTDHEDDPPIFTLHAVSASSPVRKKVHITIHRGRIRFTNVTSGLQEASTPFVSLHRGFLVPTPGKTKPHWTVIILSNAEQDQIIFGIDAVPPGLTTTVHPAPPHCHSKGTEVKPVLMQFFSHLPPRVVIQEPSISLFRSATGEPFLDAYLRARDGHLLFFKDGILFGEKKPCMWIGMEKIDSIKSLSATGRTFSLFVKHIAANTELEEDEGGEETEFSLIDGKNQDPVARWVQDNRHRFGVRQTSADVSQNETEVDELGVEDNVPEKAADEDSGDDSDFESDSESDGGSATSESSGTGNASGGEEEELGNHTDEEEDILDSSKHPLLREGAVPKMSRATLDAVVGMVEEDMVAGLIPRAARTAGEDEDEDVDELDD